MASQELDLVNRDPNDINPHVKVNQVDSIFSVIGL